MGPPAKAGVRDTRGEFDWPKPSRGVVVALVGPDGVGKTSQTAQLTNILQKKFKCTAVYLGCGDGGWAFRRSLKKLLRRWRLQASQEKPSLNSPARERVNDSLRTALAGLVIALERYWSMLRAMRLAESGSIVISDRWPQNMQPGLFDGPFRLHPHASGLVGMLSRIERYVYHRMEAHKPNVTVHLISDFATSNARKPGDRSPLEFKQRLKLMQEMRRRDPRIMTVDARNGFDEVTDDLLECISVALSQQSQIPKERPSIVHVLCLLILASGGTIGLSEA